MIDAPGRVPATSFSPTSRQILDESRTSRCYVLPGLTFRVISRVPDALAHIESVFCDFPLTTAADVPSQIQDFEIRSVEGGYSIESEAGGLGKFSSPIHAAEYLQWHVTQRALSSTEDSVALHGAGVAVDSRGLLLVGPSGTGKSTLTSKLVSRRFDYLSDEALLVSIDDGLIRPFPRAIGLLEESTSVDPRGPIDAEYSISMKRKRFYPVGDMGASVATHAVRPDVLALISRGHRVTSIEPVSPTEALPELLEQVFPMGPAETVLSTLVRLVSTARIYRLNAAYPAEAVEMLIHTFAGADTPSR